MNELNEVQRFNQKWIWMIIIISGLLPVVIELGTWWMGGEGASPLVGCITSAVILAFAIFIIRIFRLDTHIDENGVSYRLFPIQTKMEKKEWSSLARVYVRQYRPLREYGGWGYRYSFKRGTAYNISGDMGLQLVLENGKRILIGTQKPEEIKQLLEVLARSGKIMREQLTPDAEV